MAYIEWWNRTGPITLGERFGLNEISTRAKTLSPTKSYAKKPDWRKDEDWDDKGPWDIPPKDPFKNEDWDDEILAKDGGRIGFGDGTTLKEWIDMHGYGDKEVVKIKELIKKYKKPTDSKVSNEAKSAIAKARLTGFAQDFKEIFKRKPSPTEIRNLANADFTAIKKYLTYDQMLTVKESKGLIQNLPKIIEERRKTKLEGDISRGVTEPRITAEYTRPGKIGSATITGAIWPSDKVKADYIKDFLKNYELQKDGSYIWRKNWKPEGSLTSEQKALKYLPTMAKRSMKQAIQAIANLNQVIKNELTETGKFKWTKAPEKESKIKRTERITEADIKAGEDARLINAKQAKKLAELNKYFANNPEAILKYPKLMALADTGFDASTGTITKKGHDAAYFINKAKSGTFFGIDHITRVATERMNVQNPINRQFLPQNFNQGTLTSIQAWLNKNWNNPDAVKQKNKLLDFFKKYKIRTQVEGVKKIQGADIVPAIDRATNTLPNIEANLEAVGLSSKSGTIGSKALDVAKQGGTKVLSGVEKVIRPLFIPAVDALLATTDTPLTDKKHHRDVTSTHFWLSKAFWANAMDKYGITKTYSMLKNTPDFTGKAKIARDIFLRAGINPAAVRFISSKVAWPATAAASVYDSYKDYQKRKPDIEKQKELIKEGVIKEEEFDKKAPMFAQGGIASLMK